MTTQEVLEKIPQKLSTQSVREVLFENEQVVVIATNYPVGGSVPMHSHPFPHVLYVVEGGTTETTDADGRIKVLDAFPGQAIWREPQSHSVRNIGSTPVRIVEVEIKHANSVLKGEKVPRLLTLADLNWTSDPLDPTREIALMVGDPTKPGPYTARFRTGPNYDLGLHMHPNEDEYLTVLSGTLHWSTGQPGSGAPEHEIPAGSFIVFPAGTPHRIWTKKGVELQMSGIGPRQYVFLNLEEDREV